MEKTITEKKATREIRTRNGARRSRIATPRFAWTSLQTAADRQIAEMEATFTRRYEW